MWIMRVGNLYIKSNNTWYPLFEILLTRQGGARWLDDVEFEFWNIRAYRSIIFQGEQFLVECLELQDSIHKMALIMQIPDGYLLGGVEDEEDEQLP